MALPLHTFNVIEVKPPRVGELKPAAVTADIILDLARASARLNPRSCTLITPVAVCCTLVLTVKCGR